MPRYILHGGMVVPECDSNIQYFREMIKNIPIGGTWLGIYFARRDDDKGQGRFERDVALFKVRVPERSDVKFIIATEKDWPQQVQNADTIHMAGGDTRKLLNTLNEVNNHRDLFILNKTYSGSSAGMYALGRDSLDSIDDTGKEFWLDGLNILPYGMVAHYGAPEYHATQANLASRKRPLLMLAETQFVVIEQ